MNGGILLIILFLVIGYIHKWAIPKHNKLKKLARIEKRMGFEISEWYAQENFKED